MICHRPVGKVEDLAIPASKERLKWFRNITDKAEELFPLLFIYFIHSAARSRAFNNGLRLHDLGWTLNKPATMKEGRQVHFWK
jgi:hypothetical protein